MKTTLFLKQNLPFASVPRTVELENERILCNDIRFPWESHPRNLRLFVIGNEYGALGAVWADCEQDALDELVNSGLGDGLLLDEETFKDYLEDEDRTEAISYLGNAGEPADLEHCWIGRVEFDKVRDFDLILKFAELRGSGGKTLDDI
jgi:hypothetical protein